MKFSDYQIEFMNYSKENDLFKQGDKIIVALSGGCDSMLLLSFMNKLKEKGYIRLHAFHLNHSLRTEADSEADFVYSFCLKNDIPLTVEKIDVEEYALKNSLSTETAGRNLRYSLLRKLKEKLGYDYIATAHHADDNLETIIMRLIRGSAVKGMGGISPKNKDIIRPILYLCKDEILNICTKNDIPFVTDMSNFDDIYFRNRIRNNIIPLLKEENPNLANTVLNSSEIFRDTQSYFDRMADSFPIKYEDDKVSIECEYFKHKDEYVISLIIMKLLSYFDGGKDIGYSHIKKLTSLVKTNEVRWQYHLPGLTVTLFDGIMSAGKIKVYEKKEFCYPLKIGEKQVFEDIGVVINTKIIKKDENFRLNSYIKSVDYDTIRGSIFIVNRKDGMKFSPAGRNMTKSVSKYFSDMKLPMAMRDSVPILVCGDDIITVGCYEVDDKYKITGNTKNILTVSIEYIKEK